ncbi:hypothetical protein HK405_014958 [Cladochytrium tenue]|nr:hypothetical protein HK405_014958 [Cladochytrium tenue]
MSATNAPGNTGRRLSDPLYWDAYYAQAAAAVLPAANVVVSTTVATSATGAVLSSSAAVDDGGSTPNLTDATTPAPTHEWFRDWDGIHALLRDAFLAANPPPPPSPPLDHDGTTLLSSSVSGDSDRRDPSILHLGSGDSIIPAELSRLGYRRQLCVDFSAALVALMRDARAPVAGVTWACADVRAMGDVPLVAAAAPFKLAFDKGTLDAMVHGSPWDPPEDVRESIRKYLDEVHHVLAPDGVFVCVSFRQPHFLRLLLPADVDSRWTWRLSLLDGTGAGSFAYHTLVMRKL